MSQTQFPSAAISPQLKGSETRTLKLKNQTYAAISQRLERRNPISEGFKKGHAQANVAMLCLTCAATNVAPGIVQRLLRDAIHKISRA
jgi:hypothetical protein